MGRIMEGREVKSCAIVNVGMPRKLSDFWTYWKSSGSLRSFEFHESELKQISYSPNIGTVKSYGHWDSFENLLKFELVRLGFY